MTKPIETADAGPASSSTDLLGGSDDILTRLLLAQCGACTCLTKTPDEQYHATNCTYRVLREAGNEILTVRAKAARWDAVETLMILGDVELTQAEDGGYRIAVEPVENILPTSWEGGDPDSVADKVVAQLTPPKKTIEAKPPRPDVVGIFNGGDHAQVTACREQNPAPAEMPATENDTVRASNVSLPRGGEKPPNG